MSDLCIWHPAVYLPASTISQYVTKQQRTHTVQPQSPKLKHHSNRQSNSYRSRLRVTRASINKYESEPRETYVNKHTWLSLKRGKRYTDFGLGSRLGSRLSSRYGQGSVTFSPLQLSSFKSMGKFYSFRQLFTVVGNVRKWAIKRMRLITHGLIVER